MATQTITIPAGSVKGGAGEVLRAMGKQLINLATNVPDQTPTGASTVLTIDNNPSQGIVTFQITAGPYTGSVYTA